jgi:hypothetical protein
MGRACGMNGRKEKYVRVLNEWWGKLKERDKMEDLGVGRRVILKGF